MVTSAATAELGLAVLREFYVKLEPTNVQLVPEGKEFKVVSLFEKRGLLDETCVRLGLRANPRSNEVILRELAGHFGWNELVASGLWLEADRKRKLDRRPNSQFFGKGQVGRKPEAERRHRDDKVIWGWCQPVLIPYFNEMGELMKLRPHMPPGRWICSPTRRSNTSGKRWNGCCTSPNCQTPASRNGCGWSN